MLNVRTRCFCLFNKNLNQVWSIRYLQTYTAYHTTLRWIQKWSLLCNFPSIGQVSNSRVLNCDKIFLELIEMCWKEPTRPYFQGFHKRYMYYKYTYIHYPVLPLCLIVLLLCKIIQFLYLHMHVTIDLSLFLIYLSLSLRGACKISVYFPLNFSAEDANLLSGNYKHGNTSTTTPISLTPHTSKFDVCWSVQQHKVSITNEWKSTVVTRQN